MSRSLFHQTCQSACVRFTPSNSGQRSPPTYYRGCWHVVCRGFLVRYRLSHLPVQQSFTSRGISSLTRRRWVRVSSIAQYSPLLPPVGVWTVLSSNVAVQPLSPATRLRLGEPLPHLLADRTRAAPKPDCSFYLPAYGVLADVSICCPPVWDTFSRVTHPSATRIIIQQAFKLFPFDLHVLGTPPAFILSQDQTLRLIPVCALILTDLSVSQDLLVLTGLLLSLPISGFPTGVVPLSLGRREALSAGFRFVPSDRPFGPPPAASLLPSACASCSLHFHLILLSWC